MTLLSNPAGCPIRSKSRKVKIKVNTAEFVRGHLTACFAFFERGGGTDRDRSSFTELLGALLWTVVVERWRREGEMHPASRRVSSAGSLN